MIKICSQPKRFVAALPKALAFCGNANSHRRSSLAVAVRLQSTTQIDASGGRLGHKIGKSQGDFSSLAALPVQSGGDQQYVRPKHTSHPAPARPAQNLT